MALVRIVTNPSSRLCVIVISGAAYISSAVVGTQEQPVLF